MHGPNQPPAPPPATQNNETLEGFEGWRFGACELRPQRRELHVNGSLRPLPAKAFDLLLLLVRERHRVVSHDELTQRLWAQGDAAGRMLPTTIAKLRAVIDTDDRERGHETSAIRTVHRTGYRFVAALHAIEPDAPRLLIPPSPVGPAFEPGAGAAVGINPSLHSTEQAPLAPLSAATPLPGATPPSAPPRRLGLLRCLNLTGQPALAGTEVGLLALAGHALARDARLSVANTDLPLNGPSPDAQDGDASVARLMQSLGLHALLRCSLQAVGDLLVLDYTLMAQGQPPVQGQSQGICPQVLARQMAQWVQGLLFGQQAAAVRLESDDEFVNLAFARAVALYAQGDYAAAAELMTVVHHMQPSSLAAELWRLRAWSRANDPRAAAASADFLARASASGGGSYLTLAQAALDDQTYI